MTDYPDWNDASAYAAAIATGNPGGTPGGVPLLHNTSGMISASLTNITAGTNQNTGFFATGQIGYECFFTAANHTSLVAATFIKIVFDWQDAASGQIVLTESWVICTGPSNNAHTLTGRGPSAANELRITVFNDGSSADAADVTMKVFNSSRIYTRSDMRTANFQSASFTKYGQGLDQDVVGASSPAVLGSGGTWTRLMPLYAGQANLFGLTSSGAADGEFSVESIASVFAMTSNNFVFDGFTNAHGALFQALTLPRIQCITVATNHNAGTFGLSATMILIETET